MDKSRGIVAKAARSSRRLYGQLAPSSNSFMIPRFWLVVPPEFVRKLILCARHTTE